MQGISDFEKAVSRKANARMATTIAAIISSTWLIAGKLNALDHRLEQMVTIGEFIQWQKAFEDANIGSGIKVPNMALFHQRAKMEKKKKIPTDQEIVGIKGTAYAN